MTTIQPVSNQTLDYEQLIGIPSDYIKAAYFRVLALFEGFRGNRDNARLHRALCDHQMIHIPPQPYPCFSCIKDSFSINGGSRNELELGGILKSAFRFCMYPKHSADINKSIFKKQYELKTPNLRGNNE